MRQIKFRVFDKSIPKDISDEEINNPSGKIIDWDYVKDSTYLFSLWTSQYAIMQFTGITDKNGKEIYEGDIVRCEIYERENYDEYNSGENILVTYDYSCCGFYPFIKASQWRSSVEDIEVVGNKFENPELL